MDAIVAVNADWGIGANGTQQVVLKADRKHFKDHTTGATVIVGRKTMEDFPGGKPLQGRRNLVVTRQDIQIEGAEVVHGVDEAVAKLAEGERCFVIGGASVFKQFFPVLTRVFITKLDLAPHSDSFFPNLDEDENWTCCECSEWMEENGVRYQFCTYERK